MGGKIILLEVHAHNTWAKQKISNIAEGLIFQYIDSYLEQLILTVDVTNDGLLR